MTQKRDVTEQRIAGMFVLAPIKSWKVLPQKFQNQEKAKKG